MVDPIVPSADGFSLFELLTRADPIVIAVLVVLLVASAWSWAIILEKLFSLSSTRSKAQRFEAAFWAGKADTSAGGNSQGDAAARVFSAASREWNDTGDRALTEAEAAAMVSRAERAMRATIDREISRASRGTGVLATVGSASPFIGLFGTVWGIMNAFIEIGAKQDTSLAVVAGPIAEALFATGLGLIAAIPAVIFYNKFTGDITRFADQLDTFSQDVLVRLSRRASEWASNSKSGG